MSLTMLLLLLLLLTLLPSNLCLVCIIELIPKNNILVCSGMIQKLRIFLDTFSDHHVCCTDPAHALDLYIVMCFIIC
jgi:hypothetical protein